jgi:hypothetical protein
LFFDGQLSSWFSGHYNSRLTTLKTPFSTPTTALKHFYFSVRIVFSFDAFFLQFALHRIGIRLWGGLGTKRFRSLISKVGE